MKVCLVTLIDGDIKLVTTKQMEWIRKEGKDSASSWREVEPGTRKKVTVTCGSFDNDRAIAATALAGRDFMSNIDALAYAKQQGHEVTDVYAGLSY